MNTSRLLKRLSWISILAFLPLFAQDTPTEEQPTPEAVTYTYHVPFPEKNFLNLAHFRLELTSVTGEDFTATLAGFKEKGQVAFREEARSHGGATLLSWDSISKAAPSVQSLEIVSDSQLTGALWLWDDQLGFFNGVGLVEPGQSLVMPFVPSDFYSWQTRFAVKGLSARGLVSNVVFGYHDGAQLYDESLAWAGLVDRGFFLGLPFFNIPIGNLGEAPDVRWGVVRSTDEDFKLVGYQSLMHQDFETGALQNCAIEMFQEGEAQGWTGFSAVAGFEFKNSFVFTNPNPNEPVQIELGLRSRIDVDSGETDESGSAIFDKQVAVEYIRIVLLPNQSITPTLEQLFGVLTGEPVSLSYSATTVPVVVGEGEDQPVAEPRPIFALHLQGDKTGTQLGANSFQAHDGNRMSGWFSMNAPYKALYEVFNTTDRFQKLDVAVLESNGERLALISTILAPWERTSELTAEQLRSKIIEALTLRALDLGVEPVIDPVATYRLSFSLETEGTFFGKLTGFQETDFAIVNPLMLQPQPVVEEPQPEPNSDGASAKPARN